MFRKITLILLFIALYSSAFSQISWVTSLEDDTIQGTLRYAIDHSTMGADIRFSDSLFAQGSDTLKLDSTIFIKNAVSIRGYMRDGDTLFISGEGSIKMFFVDLTFQSMANGVLTMDSLAFINGFSIAGSVIDLDNIGVTNINNCFFKNNISSYALIYHNNGGYINWRAYLYFKNNTFVENTGCLMRISNVEEVHMSELYSTNNNSGVIDVDAGSKLTATHFYLKDNYQLASSTGWLLFLSSNSLLTDSLFAIDNTGFTPFCFLGSSQHHKNLYAINNSGAQRAGAVEVRSYGQQPPLFENCIFKYNKGKLAGAIQGNSLSMKNSIIRGNITDYPIYGEGTIWIYGNLSISFMDCVIDSNVTVNGEGGAIKGQTHHLYLERVAIYENDGGTKGGAITLQYTDSLTIIDSYIGDNRAPKHAGIFGGGYTYIRNSSICNNIGSTGSGGVVTGKMIDIGGSLIAGNTPANFGVIGFVQPFISIGYNIIQENIPLNGFQLTDIINPPSSILPMGPLADNGGIGFTRMPLAGNVALNQGNPSDTSDAFNSSINDGRRDIGAIESSDTSLQSYSVYEICDSTLLNGTWATQTGYYIDSVKSALNTDSIAIINIIQVYQSTHSTDVQNTCDSLKWIDGNTYYSDNNTATVKLTSQHGCDSIVTLNFTKTIIDTSLTVTSSQIELSSTNALIQWYSCDSTLQLIPNANNRIFTPSSNGSYLAVLEKNSCSDTTRCVNFTNRLSLNNQFQVSTLNVYPNPVENILSVEWQEGFAPTSAKIYSMQGQFIRNVDLPNESYINQIELGDFPEGCYVFIFKYESGIIDKVVIRKK